MGHLSQTLVPAWNNCNTSNYSSVPMISASLSTQSRVSVVFMEYKSILRTNNS
jgi:hypothetical protein